MNPLIATFNRVNNPLLAWCTARLRVLGLLVLLGVQVSGSELPVAAAPPARPTSSAYLYAGEQFDPDLGLYYNRARYLNPDTGRFWNMDTYEGSDGEPMSLHKYLYANADPVNGIDPSGHMTLVEINVSSAIQNTLQTIRAEGPSAALRKLRTRVAMVYLGGGPGTTQFGHTFIYVEFLQIRNTGIYFDANPSKRGVRQIMRAGGINLGGLWNAGSVPGQVSPEAMSKADAMKKGRLLPVARLGTIGFVGWSSWIRGIDGDLSYNFFAVPGGSSVSCYTWAAESAAKAFVLGLLPF